MNEMGHELFQTRSETMSKSQTGLSAESGESLIGLINVHKESLASTFSWSYFDESWLHPTKQRNIYIECMSYIESTNVFFSFLALDRIVYFKWP